MGYTRASGVVGGVRARAVKRVLWMILGLNLAVTGAKLVYGIVIDSVAMTADGFHSLFDGTSNIIGLIGMSWAIKPADADHPYGHAKYETFASLVIGAMLVVAAWRVGSSAVARLVSGGTVPSVDTASFVIMVVTLMINIAVTTYERRMGERLSSEILSADADHTASDVLVSLGVLASLIAVRLGYPVADPLIGLLVAVFIVRAAVRVFRAANATLSDQARLQAGEVCEAVLAVPGVRGCHDVRTRGSASEIYVDLHVQVDPALTVSEGHRIAEAVERTLCERFDDIADVVAHLEPYDDYQRAKTERQATERRL